MRSKKYTDRELCEIFSGKIKFICGKWFNQYNEEIKRIDSYLMRTGYFNTANDVIKFKDTFIMAYGEFEMDWPDLPIVEEAKHCELEPLCYPLNEKQLIIINYLLRHDEEIFFILTGVGGSGKSTFANIIRQVFDNDYAPLDLQQLSDPYTLATGVGRRLICSDELNSKDLDNGTLKKIFSNQPITINPKFAKPYESRFQAAFFFNCNEPPKLDLTDTGMMRRILYYEMNEKIANPDPTLNRKVFSHKDLVNIVAHALQVDMTDWKSKFEKETRDCLVKNNSVYLCREEYKYVFYADRCKLKGLKPFSEPNWQRVRSLLIEWGYINVQAEENSLCK